MIELAPGVWRGTARHPDWTEAEGGEDGWDPDVAWWAIATSDGLVLVDPLVTEWETLDDFVDRRGGCAGVVRTIHWHERSVAAAAARYGAEVWAMAPSGDTPRRPYDRAIADRDELWDGIRAYAMHRHDELALWLPGPEALLFADAILGDDDGGLRVCPESWLAPKGGMAQLRTELGALAELPVEHVLVCHGSPVIGDGRATLAAALRS